MTVLQFRPKQTGLSFEEKADRDFKSLIAITNKTCLIALDKALSVIISYESYTSAAERCRSLSEKLVTAYKEVGYVLNPPNTEVNSLPSFSNWPDYR